MNIRSGPQAMRETLQTCHVTLKMIVDPLFSRHEVYLLSPTVLPLPQRISPLLLLAEVPLNLDRVGF